MLSFDDNLTTESFIAATATQLDDETMTIKSTADVVGAEVTVKGESSGIQCKIEKFIMKIHRDAGRLGLYLTLLSILCVNSGLRLFLHLHFRCCRNG